MSWTDEKNLVIATIIASSLIMVTLSLEIGIIAIMFSWIYFKFKYIEFSKTGKFFSPDVILAVLFGVGAYNILSVFFSVANPFSVFATFSEFTLDNPLIKMVVWGVLLPLVETLFFYGFLTPALLRRLNMPLKITVETAVICFLVSIGISVYHLKSQIITSDNITADILFFTVSGLMVLFFNELKQSYYFHSAINIISMATKLGLLELAFLVI